MAATQNNEITQSWRHPHTASLRRADACGYVLQIATLALAAAPITYLRPDLATFLTGATWFAFSIYWSLVA